MPTESATDQRAPLRRSAAATRMRRASVPVSGSMSISSPIGASTRTAILLPTLPRFQATFRARDTIRWIWTTVLGLRS
jgi:hypothetical protein